jgi:ketosteroid isomerase-like protein
VSDQTVQVVKDVYAAFGRGDVPAVLGAMTADIEWFEAEGMPYGGRYQGPQAVAENVLGPITTDIEGFTVTPQEYVASGDSVVSIGRYTGTGRRPGNSSTSPMRTPGRSRATRSPSSCSSWTRRSSWRLCRPE